MQISKVLRFATISIIFLFCLNITNGYSQNQQHQKTKEYVYWNYIDSILTYHCSDVKGISKRKNIQLLNSLKNRSEISSQITKIDINSFYDNKNDLNRYSINTYGEITGKVIRVKISDPETCNCNISDYRMRDIHIAIIPNNSKYTLPIIVEITPRTKLKFAENKNIMLDHNLLKKYLLGKTVTFQGWMFFDSEHFENSKNTMNRNTNHIWRQSAWEIHPVINFFVNE